jgi:hypothetical protein
MWRGVLISNKNPPENTKLTMLNARIPAMRNQALIGISLFLVAIWAAYQTGGKIAEGDLQTLIFISLGFAACVVAVTILRNWRSGFYLFLGWLLFEDLVRKFMGNNLALFFGKDILLGLVYISIFAAIRNKKEKRFRPPFLFFLSLFIWLGVLQIFNQNSPHILYGLLGFKIYFYYIPLIWVGYAVIRNDMDLRKFLVTNAALAGVIAVLGLVQAVVGNTFLNPAVLAPDLRDLEDLQKVTPLTSQLFSLPSSVFVSSGRYATYLIVAFILLMGSAGYLLLSTLRGRKLVYLVLGLLGAATLFSGNRGAVVSVAASAIVLTIGFLWGAPWRQRQAHRILKAVRRSLLMAAVGLVAALLLFPKEAGSRIAYYAETLLPSSSAYQLGTRSWDYPILNLENAFDRPNWVLGNGIGTASLGMQYVSRLLHQAPPNLSVEEGFGTMIVEMGIVAPFLWILWSIALLYYSWKIVRRLRETRFFPIALAIFWYAFLLLLPLTFGSLNSYQNYVCNAYLWLLVGILFRLPDVLVQSPTPAEAPSRAPNVRGGFQF